IGVSFDTLRGVAFTEVSNDQVEGNYFTEHTHKLIYTIWKIIPTSNPVVIQWSLYFHLRWYPWEKFSSLLFEKRYGPVMEQGLNNLKNYLENNHSSNK